MFNRHFSENLLSQFKNSSREVIIVEGARQVGKSTLIESVLEKVKKEDFNYKVIQINLETDLITLKEFDSTKSFEEFEIYLKTRFDFSDEEKSILFIDEAQESEVLGAYVRSFKEKWKNAKVVLSGSSMRRLFREDQRVPVGRYKTLLITPLSFVEFLEARKKDSLLELIEEINLSNYQDSKFNSEFVHRLFLEELDIYLQIGGMPAVVQEYVNQGDWRRKRLDILLSQEDDFIRRSKKINKELFNAGLRGIANNIGSSSKYTHISGKLIDARRVVQTLIEWKLVFEVQQRGNATTSTFYPKRYIYDIGIAQDLRLHPFPTISIIETLSSVLRTPLGGLIENALLLQLINQPDVYEISGWKNSSDENKEIDFVVRTDKLLPIECKASLKVSERNFYGVNEYLKISSLQTGFVVSLAPLKEFVKDDKKLVNLPFHFAKASFMKELVSFKK